MCSDSNIAAIISMYCSSNSTYILVVVVVST